MDQQAVVVAEMRGVRAAALILSGCAEELPEAKDSAEPWVAPLAPTWVAVTGNTYDGALKSSCTMQVEMVSVADGTVVDTITLSPADGGLWAGAPLAEGLQVTAALSWSDCENTSAGEGTFTSSSFSGERGDLFVLYYNGVGSGFEWMEQAVDHLGGELRVQFSSDSSGAEIDAIAGESDVAVAADPDDPTFRRLSWTDDRNVTEVLGVLSGEEAFLWGEPVWVLKPGWW